MAAKGLDEASKISLKMLYKQLYPHVSTSITQQKGEWWLYIWRKEFTKLYKYKLKKQTSNEIQRQDAS